MINFAIRCLSDIFHLKQNITNNANNSRKLTAHWKHTMFI